MSIRGAEGLSREALTAELARGARLVRFSYTISVLVMTFRRETDVYLIRHGESAVTKSLPWTILTLLVGWWGVPWGFIYTPMSLYTNFNGGRDVSNELV